METHYRHAEKSPIPVKNARFFRLAAMPTERVERNAPLSAPETD
jgi:hypothetical protein